MPITDPRIDAAIAKAQPFAKPILMHLRGLVHKAVPEVEETIKWGMPFFVVHGAPLANMAAFKAHCTFGFWKEKALDDPKKILGRVDAMGALGKLVSLDDLPKDAVLIDYLKRAAVLNAEGVSAPKRRRDPNENGEKVPAFLAAALKKNKQAKEQFDQFTPGKRRDYILWLKEAKTEATQQKRLANAVAWIAEGKSLNWKYEKK